MQELKFDEKGLIPAIAVDASTGEVLMMAYMNRESIEKTIETGKAHYFSRSRNKLWLKGETSGNFQLVKEILYDCDADTLLVKIDPLGPACHTGQRSCFYRQIEGNGEVKKTFGPAIVKEVFDIAVQRKGSSPEKSYVASLYAKGLEKILSKVSEESGELIEAAREKGEKEVVYEMCDLWFHSIVLLADQGIDIQEIFNELGRRFGTSGITEKESRKGKQ